MAFCAARYPADASKTCHEEADSNHPTHIAGYGSNQVDWPNEEFRPSRKIVGKDAQTKKLAELSGRVEPEVRSGPLSDFATNTKGQHHRHPRDTEEAAAYAVMPRTGTQRWRVLGHVAGAERGATDEEMQTALDMHHNTQTPRRRELERGGWVEDSGDRRRTQAGQDAIVWTLTEEARHRLLRDPWGREAATTLVNFD